MFGFVLNVFILNSFSNLGQASDDRDISKIWSVLEETRKELSRTKLELSRTQIELVESKSRQEDLGQELDKLMVTWNQKNNYEKRLLNIPETSNQVQLDLLTLKSEMAALQSKVSSINIPRVGFTAILSHDASDLGTNQIIKFDRVLSNEGGNYNDITGIFTCEIPGLYVFYVHTLTEFGKLVETQLMKNAEGTIRTYAYDKEALSSGSNLAVIPLQKGDTVFVKFLAGDHAGAVLDYLWTSFSGFLIHN